MKRLIKKLALRRDTIRALSDIEGAAVHAGQFEFCTYFTREASSCFAAPESPEAPAGK